MHRPVPEPSCLVGRVIAVAALLLMPLPVGITFLLTAKNYLPKLKKGLRGTQPLILGRHKDRLVRWVITLPLQSGNRRMNAGVQPLPPSLCISVGTPSVSDAHIQDGPFSLLMSVELPLVCPGVNQH